MDSIAISLGHNSSAIAIRNGRILGGYETERFTGIKSDSAYPKEAIDRLVQEFNLNVCSDMYLGQWFLNTELPATSNKYLNYEHLNSKFPGGSILSVDREFTHHDSHVESAMVFAGDDFAPEYHALVMDGFGSFGECISIYKVKGRSRTLLSRWFGFEKSLGMLYQYATAYMGMKMHNHEYKMLAYETHVAETGHDPEYIRDYARGEAAKFIKTMIKGEMNSRYDPMISLEALPRIQIAIGQQLDKFCDTMGVDKKNELEFRSCVSSYVQTYVETVTLTLLEMYQPKDVLLAGGLFYNVKLNSLIQKNIPGRLCVMPLAGDQGAALGVYQRYVGDLKWPGHLFWGKRETVFQSSVPGIIQVGSMYEAEDIINSEINRIGFVNLVRGAMEFGPRALCNTTTLALPTENVRKIINQANDRTDTMPMAPVMGEFKASKVFHNIEKIHKSLDYMIVTRDYQPGMGEQYTGAAHFYPEEGLFTGRPQITNDLHLLKILDKHDGVLVNTSFNYHGVPIVFDKDSIEYSHLMQRQKCPSCDIKTVVVSNLK